MLPAGRISAPDFDLRTTLRSGQVFRFDERGDCFYLRVGDKIIRLRQEGERLEFLGCSGSFLRKLFQLDEDLEAVQKALSGDAVLRVAIETYPGLRLMRQEPWECLVSFICSQASNIPRIKRNIEGLCRLYGHPIHLDGFSSYSFPEPGTLRDEQAMRGVGVGFRAKYLVAVNDAAARLDLDSLRHKSYGEAKASLTELSGVGEKVADCVLLFSLGFSQAFPVDVWIKRAMEEYYFRGRKTPLRDIRQFAADHFGPNAGYAQQYLFHYARMRNRTDA